MLFTCTISHVKSIHRITLRAGGFYLLLDIGKVTQLVAAVPTINGDCFLQCINPYIVYNRVIRTIHIGLVSVKLKGKWLEELGDKVVVVTGDGKIVIVRAKKDSLIVDMK